MDIKTGAYVYAYIPELNINVHVEVIYWPDYSDISKLNENIILKSDCGKIITAKRDGNNFIFRNKMANNQKMSHGRVCKLFFSDEPRQLSTLNPV